MSETDFTAKQGFAAQAALREALDMGPARFSLTDLVRMLGDEIAAHRSAGKDWVEITGVIEGATGQTIAPETVEHIHGGGGRR